MTGTVVTGMQVLTSCVHHTFTNTVIWFGNERGWLFSFVQECPVLKGERFLFVGGIGVWGDSVEDYCVDGMGILRYLLLGKWNW